MPDNKTKPTDVSVAAFIDALTDDSKRTDAKALVKLMQNAIGEKPKMWDPPSSDWAAITTSTGVGARATCPLPDFRRARPPSFSTA